MDSFYQPSQIFRQPRVDKTRKSSSRITSESWMLNSESSSTDVLNKSINEPNYKINSNYWKIPDNNLYLTSLAVNPEYQNQIAVASGSHDSNLFIYDFDHSDLTHKQTISLPKITSMSWLDYAVEESSLLTGHKNGMIHFVSIPNASEGQNARIVKRFNHAKHFTSSFIKSTTIANLQTPKSWLRNQNNLISSCNGNVFLWDINHRSDLPIMKNQHLGLLNFDISLSRVGILGLAGEFGIALNDLRVNENSPSIFEPKKQASGVQSSRSVNLLKWAQYDSNVLAAAHEDNVIRLWDIRNHRHFGELKGHNDEITSLEWSEQSSGDLYSCGRDGKLIHWDLNFNESLMNCTLNQGIESVATCSKSGKFLTDEFEIFELLQQRQCGTVISSSSSPIIDLHSCMDKIISIDQESFLGMHAKNGTDAFKAPTGLSTLIMDEILQDLPDTLSTPLPSPSNFTNFSNKSVISVNSEQSSLFDSVGNSQTSISSPISASNEGRLSVYSTGEDPDMGLNSKEIKAAFTYKEISPLHHSRPLSSPLSN
ncbi:hypothetical protein WICPIJ_001674 [Wickerhamomyces pijperi]|uniref:Anaphase-promoting complex subunit 4-like WD40 domain-containing protein n=1 Tax=Wickerhamomyces pijperi TaxID=599730 RepID=A0A9P8QCT4_WICPI|nr:hypothetical protein WICPIJ_001674 [Wickerhamomyces pijperi]